MTLIRQNVCGAVLASSGAGCRNLILIPPLKGLEHSENTYIQLTASGPGWWIREVTAAGELAGGAAATCRRSNRIN